MNNEFRFFAEGILRRSPTDLREKYLIIILGPTGIGKTGLSINIAKRLNTEIISCDSRQFFKELSIGTAVPSKEQLTLVKHHFIHNMSIHDYYNASKFESEVIDLLIKLFRKKDYVIMVGGSGMYIDAVCHGIDDLPEIDPELRRSLHEKLEKEGLESLRFDLKKVDPDYYKTVDLKNSQRILRALEVFNMTGKPYSSFRKKIKKKRDFSIFKVGLNMDRKKLYEKINKRVDNMIAEGLVEEARSVLKYRDLTPLKTVGYRELFGYFDKKTTLEEATEKIKSNTRKYARRQLTWFGRDKDIKWFNPDEKDKILNYIKNHSTI